MATISRQQYNNLFGPTTGDKIRLGDTELYVEIEKDLRVYGDEVVYGGGKTIRDGMGTANTVTSDGGSLDLVITNVTILDPILGVIKADVGVKDGKIAGIGKAGNPNVMKGVTPTLCTGPSTDAISGEHLILTAAGIDGHVHFVAPQQAYNCLSNGITTLIGGGIGPQRQPIGARDSRRAARSRRHGLQDPRRLGLDSGCYPRMHEFGRRIRRAGRHTH